jgi:hypothetical protein
MPTTSHHATLVIDQLARRRRHDGTIDSIGSVEVIEACGYNARDYAKAYGQAISVLDAACLTAGLPWLGRLVRFKTFRENLNGAWEIWGPFMPEILEAPLRRPWADEDFTRIKAAFPTVGVVKWWKEQEAHSEALLQQALAATRQ